MGNALQAKGRGLRSDTEIEHFRKESRVWDDYNEELLGSIFTTDKIAKEYVGVVYGVMAGDAPNVVKMVMDHNASQIARLESILQRLELFPEPSAMPSSVSKSATPLDRSKVFVVHGHDDVARLAVARFLEQIGLEAIILSEQPDQGRTIIEKFEECAADVGFAVVLLTPDDLGGVATAPVTGSRARQNVIFELGYFAGKLGRGRACLMRKGVVEIPSDLHGVIYTDMDVADGWKLKLVKELKAAKLEFDANRMWA